MYKAVKNAEIVYFIMKEPEFLNCIFVNLTVCTVCRTDAVRGGPCSLDPFKVSGPEWLNHESSIYVSPLQPSLTLL